MRLRRALWVNGALVLLALTSTVAVILTEGRVTTSERLARENNVFRSWRPQELREVRIAQSDRPQAPDLRLARIPDSPDPHDFALGEDDLRKADPAAVSELLGALEYATWLRRVGASEVDRKGFGLQNPQLEVRVTFRDTDYRLIVGDEAPSPRGAHYAELTGTGVPDPGIGLVAGETVQQLRVDVRAFLGRQLLPYAKSELARVKLAGPEGDRLLLRDARGWRLDSPEGPRADSTSVDRIFFQMARVSASRYVDLREAQQALKSADVVKVEQSPQQGQAVRVRLGGECPGSQDEVLVVRETDPAVAGCVPATVLPALRTPREQLTDRTPFPFQPDEVDHLTVVQGTRVLEAVRTGSRFDLLRPRRAELELDAGNDFLQALVAPEGELWRDLASRPSEPDLERLGLSPPLGTITLRGLVEVNDEAVELKVDYGKPDADGRVWIRRHDDGAVLALSAQRAEAFSADDTWTRSRVLLQIDKQAIQRVEVNAEGSRRIIERGPNGGLQLVEPPDFAIDGGLATDWLAALSELRAVRWIAPTAPTAKANLQPAQRVEVTYELDGERRQLTFVSGSRVPGGYLAELGSADDEPARFVLPTEARRTLNTLPISRLTMSPDVDKLEKVVLEAHGVQTTLERRAGELISADGSLPAETVAALELALGGLHPEAAARVGPPLPGEGIDSPELTLTGRLRSSEQAAQTFTYRFGRVTTWQGRTVQFARAEGVNSTFLFDRSQVQRLLDLL